MADTERSEPRPGILYVDTSALLKLLVREAESEAVETELLQWSKLATSVVTEVELPRAVARARDERPDAVIDGSVVLQGILAAAAIVPLDAGIVAGARDVSPVHVGALDAIHVASALSLGRDLAAVATYDHRMQDALAQIEIEVLAPERESLGDGDERGST
jgi:predicted nucleic acid-binding protein